LGVRAQVLLVVSLQKIIQMERFSVQFYLLQSYSVFGFVSLTYSIYFMAIFFSSGGMMMPPPPMGMMGRGGMPPPPPPHMMYAPPPAGGRGYPPQ
jgi:hypothetical protein